VQRPLAGGDGPVHDCRRVNVQSALREIPLL
jgi:hypothetical protein